MASTIPKIFIGPAGTSGLGYEVAIEQYAAKGFHAMEVEFTYGVRMDIARAKALGRLAQKHNISLTVHAPYYINLASFEQEKVEASKKRILDSCERAHYLGAKYVIFHAAFYSKRNPEEVFQIVKHEILDLQDTLTKKGWESMLAPETTGKPSQFGSLEELKRMSDETGCGVCVDFAHLLARHGSIDYDKVLPIVKQIKHVTGHFSGINYGEKGEKNHILTPPKEIKRLIKALFKHGVSIKIINESPEPISDTELTKEILDELTLQVTPN